jgi:hypothetical protein
MSVFGGKADKLCGPLGATACEQGFWLGSLRGYTKSRIEAAKKWEGLRWIIFLTTTASLFWRQRLHRRAIRKAHAHEQR